MERASLKAKAAALREKLAIEQEEAEWHAEKRFREVQLQAEEKQREVEFEAQKKRVEAAIKAKKEMHMMQTALAESDAKMEVLQKYENKQDDNSFTQADQQDGKADTKPALQLPSQETFKASSFKYNAPPAIVQMTTSAPKTEIKDQQGFTDDKSKPESSEVHKSDILCSSTSHYLIQDFIGEGCFGKVAKDIKMLNVVSFLDPVKKNMVQFFEKFYHNGQTCLTGNILN
ncbi:uncharacterized protein AKAME5_001308900 [Lates japonicus]|uniref:Uncharacterized protein n=1 Tax=Lates japonicus TaxID=270547 RepID=A0AAD3MWZ1_LATJO|nr:uncharacterized protein AKAME5_001308900 [Lates japonicus]